MLALLAKHRDLGVHTELLSEGFVDLVEKGAVTGTRKRTHRNKIITTSAVGTKHLYEFVADNRGSSSGRLTKPTIPVTSPPSRTSPRSTATIEVDFLSQCASESLGTAYWSSSGGQPDFARGAVLSEGGQAFIVLHSTTGDEQTSRIVPRLHPGAAVTTFKNVVDHVVTEYGVVELRGSTIAERTRRLIAIAHPKFRNELTAEAQACGSLSAR